MRHLLTIQGLAREELEEILDSAASFMDVLDRDIPKVPALRGSTVATMFFEASTRTRLSFERAAKALSADVMTFNPGTSSVSKGESLKDTALTLQAMGCNLMVVRHQAVGAAHRIAEWVDCPVVNAGDGAHQHPTQALIDCLALRRRFGKLDGLRITVVGDIRHSRVARSDAFAFTTMGATVNWVAPATLLPPSLELFPVTSSVELDPLLAESDVVYLLRVQSERGATSGLPSAAEFASRYGMDRDRLGRLPDEAVIMHPGPINRGVELAGEVADDARSLIVEQVGVGVAVRMAVLFRLSGGQM